MADDYDDDDRPRRPRRDDYDDDDRPRRPRRDDYDDDRPRRARRRDYDDDYSVRRRSDEGAGAAVASLILGLIAIPISCIPWLGWIIGLICAILAIIFGSIGKNSRSSGGMAIAGLVIGLIVIALWVVMAMMVFAFGVHFYQYSDRWW